MNQLSISVLCHRVLDKWTKFQAQLIVSSAAFCSRQYFLQTDSGLVVLTFLCSLNKINSFLSQPNIHLFITHTRLNYKEENKEKIYKSRHKVKSSVLNKLGILPALDKITWHVQKIF